MIQAPQNYGMPQPVQQAKKPAFSPSYNAVQINLDTPTLNAPAAQPYYPPVNMEQYQPPQATTPVAPQAPAAAPQAPVVPAPVLDGTQPAAPQTPAAAPQTPQVEIKQPDEKGPEALVDEAFKGLSSADYDTQAITMEDIAKKGLPDKDGVTHSEAVIPYVQENIFDKLIDIMNVDTSQLAGPTEKQIDLRNKIAQNKQAKADAVKAGQDPTNVKLPFEITPQEKDEAKKLSPYEQAERNKEYAMFTTGVLQKVYSDEVQKQSPSGIVVPVTDLPGAKAVITQLKSNPNPDRRISAIDTLRYIQKPEYKDDLTRVYTIAQSDESPEVAEAATQALASLNAPEAAPQQPAAAPAEQPKA